MGIIKKFKDWFKKDKVERELLSLEEIKEEVLNILSYAFDNANVKIDVYTYYEGHQLTIEIKCTRKPCRFSLIKDDFGQFIDYFCEKYTIYDDSFMSATQVVSPYSEYENIPLEKFDDLHNGVFFRYIDIYLDKYKKNTTEK
jgi:transposase